jgi:hypothetical protein
LWLVMSGNRIQKLLLSDYGSLKENTVLVEGQFAQINAKGEGLKAVVLGD